MTRAISGVADADVPFTVGGLAQTAIISATTSIMTFGIGEIFQGINITWKIAALSSSSTWNFPRRDGSSTRRKILV